MVPNDLCDICCFSKPPITSITYYIPEQERRETCPSCGRRCEVVMHYVNLEPDPNDSNIGIGLNNYRNLPKHKKVPKNIPYKNKETMLKLPPPQFPTENWYDNYWIDYYANNGEEYKEPTINTNYVEKKPKLAKPKQSVKKEKDLAMFQRLMKEKNS
jgi:hypothetical protein